uniref:NADH dehydrogenase [ubiquinone] 1 alpha subcomplex assembly factor 3 n=1 Tax=Chlamydomonas euryale TaxID=1486919 RepID=A0A7R9YSL5_9CHLO|mmetsp:Transcript_18934/g.56430  ORF Transcript_18934/g.56430 Transcript_18934/m.56430 type:complete len:236 (+) Transcript_18934:663-1370(+)
MRHTCTISMLRMGLLGKWLPPGQHAASAASAAALPLPASMASPGASFVIAGCAAAGMHGPSGTVHAAAASVTRRHYAGAGGIANIAEHEKGNTKFSGYYAAGFYVNNVQVPGSVLALSDVFFLWRPRTLEDVTPESLGVLTLLKPRPEVLVLGCGASPGLLPPPVSKFLADHGIKVEVLDSRNATAYFNLLNDEGRGVVGALLACDATAPLPEVMPKQAEPLWERGFALGSPGIA